MIWEDIDDSQTPGWNSFQDPNRWVVSADVQGTGGAGTIYDPWSLTYAAAGAGGLIQPGDTVQLRGGTYRPYTDAGQSRSVGYLFTVNGTAAKPIIFQPYLDEDVLFSDPADLSGGWTQVYFEEDGITPIDPLATVYESNDTVGTGTQWVTCHFYDQGDWRIIGSLRGPSGGVTNADAAQALYSMSSRFLTFEGFYVGPCILPLGNRKLRIRLDPCIVQEQEGAVVQNPFFGEDTQVYPSTLNPNELDLHVCIFDDVGVSVRADYLIFEGFRFNGFNRAAWRDEGDYNVLRQCTFEAVPYIGARIGASDNSTTQAGEYYQNFFDGMLDFNTSPMARGDIKNGEELIVQNRNQVFSVDSSAENGTVWGNQFRRAFDGTVFSSPGWEVGYTPPAGFPLTDAGREQLMWDRGNLFYMIWDDGMQVFSRAQNANIHHNRFFGAGVSRDGDTSGVDYGGDMPNVHHNIFDGTNYTVVWDRAGRDMSELIKPGTGVFQTTLASGIIPADTSITVAAGTGAQYTATPPYFVTLVNDLAPYQREVIQVTARVGDVFTVVRGQTPTGSTTPTTALTLSAGAYFVNRRLDIRTTEEGRVSANVLPTHGEPADSVVPPVQKYKFPWNFYHNTILRGDIDGLPFQFLPVLMFGNNASLILSGAPKNLCFNNLFIAGGYANLGSTPTRRNTYLASSTIFTGRGDDIHDGNVYVATGGVPLLLIQTLTDSVGTTYTNTIQTIAGFRNSQLLFDALTYAGYAPGMESTGLAYQATEASQINSAYEPIDSRLATGAIDLSEFDLPGMEVYQPWRGAMAPAS